MRTCFSILITLAIFATACTRISEITERAPAQPTPSPTPALHPPEKIDAELERAIAKIAEAAEGKVGVGALLLETGDAAYLERDRHFAMQSVYKLPIAMAVAQQVDTGRYRFNSDIIIQPSDYVRRGYHSPIRNLNPRGTIMRLDDIVRYSLSESDGSASDVLLNLAGGPQKVQEYLNSIGVTDVKVADSTKDISMDWDAQYRNWATPEASVDLLVKLYRRQAGLGTATTSLVFDSMTEAETGRHRIKRGMPQGSSLAHKTGTGGRPSEVPGYWKKMAVSNTNSVSPNSVVKKTRATPTPKPVARKTSKPSAGDDDEDMSDAGKKPNEVFSAVNDIGIITLPDGRHIILAVYVNDSLSDGSTREHVIADIARAVCTRWTTGQFPDAGEYQTANVNRAFRAR